MRNFLPLLFLIGCSSVDAGNVGVKTVFGAVQPEVYREGIYFTAPGTDIVNLDARIQKTETAAAASSKDLQVVRATIALNWKIDTSKAPTIYQSIGANQAIQNNIISPVLQEAVKTATSQYAAEALIIERPLVKEAIQSYVTERLLASDIVVTDLSIVNFEFDEKYQDAIEAKQVAEQTAQAATNDLKRIEVEAMQAEAKAKGITNASLIEARAEAERQDLLRKTISPELVQWEAIQKWNGVLPTVQGGEGQIIQIPLR